MMNLGGTEDHQEAVLNLAERKHIKSQFPQTAEHTFSH